MYQISKQFTFDAAHRLPLHKGKCFNLHGHTYRVEVTLQAENLMMGEDGMLYDFGDLDTIVRKHIVEPMDHAFIGRRSDINNLPGKFFDTGDDYSTAENLSRLIFQILKQKNVPYLKEVTVWETPTSRASYTG